MHGLRTVYCCVTAVLYAHLHGYLVYRGRLLRAHARYGLPAVRLPLTHVVAYRGTHAPVRGYYLRVYGSFARGCLHTRTVTALHTTHAVALHILRGLVVTLPFGSATRLLRLHSSRLRLRAAARCHVLPRCGYAPTVHLPYTPAYVLLLRFCTGWLLPVYRGSHTLPVVVWLRDTARYTHTPHLPFVAYLRYHTVCRTFGFYRFGYAVRTVALHGCTPAFCLLRLRFTFATFTHHLRCYRSAVFAPLHVTYVRLRLLHGCSTLPPDSVLCQFNYSGSAAAPFTRLRSLPLLRFCGYVLLPAVIRLLAHVLRSAFTGYGLPAVYTFTFTAPFCVWVPHGLYVWLHAVCCTHTRVHVALPHAFAFARRYARFVTRLPRSFTRITVRLHVPPRAFTAVRLRFCYLWIGSRFWVLPPLPGLLPCRDYRRLLRLYVPDYLVLALVTFICSCTTHATPPAPFLDSRMPVATYTLSAHTVHVYGSVCYAVALCGSTVLRLRSGLPALVHVLQLLRFLPRHGSGLRVHHAAFALRAFAAGSGLVTHLCGCYVCRLPVHVTVAFGLPVVTARLLPASYLLRSHLHAHYLRFTAVNVRAPFSLLGYACLRARLVPFTFWITRYLHKLLLQFVLPTRCGYVTFTLLPHTHIYAVHVYTHYTGWLRLLHFCLCGYRFGSPVFCRTFYAHTTGLFTLRLRFVPVLLLVLRFPAPAVAAVYHRLPDYRLPRSRIALRVWLHRVGSATACGWFYYTARLFTAVAHRSYFWITFTCGFTVPAVTAVYRTHGSFTLRIRTVTVLWLPLPTLPPAVLTPSLHTVRSVASYHLDRSGWLPLPHVTFTTHTPFTLRYRTHARLRTVLVG